MLYQAFLSYSHAADGKLAPALQSALHQFAKPWYRLRALRIFRDKTSLSANPALWASIEKTLSESDYFLLLGSPEAAQSHWVKKEVGWWLEKRPVEKMLILITDGELVWDEAAGDFDWRRTTALPGNLRGRFKEEPLYVDFRWAKTVDNLSLRHSQFRGAVLDIAAPLHGKPKDELDGEDVRQNRRVKRLTWSVVITLGILVVGLGFATYYAFNQRNIAFSRELAANATSQLPIDPELSVFLAREALKVKRTPEAEVILRHSLVALQESHMRTLLAGHRGSVRSATFCPDGKRIVTASEDRLARIWDATTGKMLVELSRDNPHGDYVYTAAFSPDGKRVVTASKDGTARVWDAGTGKVLFKLSEHTGPVRTAAFSPNNTRIVTASEDKTAWVWDATTGEKLLKLGNGSSHNDLIYGAAFSADSNCIVTASKDKTARVWDSKTGKMVYKLIGHKASVRSAAFSSDNRRIVTASEDKTARIWDATTGKMLVELSNHDDWVQSAAFSPNGKFIATTSNDRTARVWDAGTGKLVVKLIGHKGSVNGVSFSPDSKFIVTASGDGTARVWEVEIEKRLVTLGGDRAHNGSVRSAAFSPDGMCIATASEDNKARVWDVTTGKLLTELAGHNGWVNTAAFSPDGKCIVTASGDKTAQVWDAATGSQLIELAGHKGWVYSATFSPDGKSIVTAGEDKTVRIYGHELCCSFDSLVSSSRFIRNLTPEEREKYLHEKSQPF